MARRPGNRLKNNKTRQAVRTFWKHIPKEEFMVALNATKEDKMLRFRAALCDPTLGTNIGKKYGIPTLCQEFDISLAELYTCWHDYKQHEGLIRAMSHIPDILEDISLDAKSGTVGCDTCKGTGLLAEDKECYICNGEGTLRIPGDADARRLILEATGFTGKKSGVNVQINNNLGESMESVVTLTSRILSEDVHEVEGREVTDERDPS